MSDLVYGALLMARQYVQPAASAGNTRAMAHLALLEKAIAEMKPPPPPVSEDPRDAPMDWDAIPPSEHG